MAEEMIWVENKTIDAPARRESRERFEKVLGAKGWVVCDPPKEGEGYASGGVISVPDPDVVRREQLQRASHPHSDDSVDAERRKELQKAMKSSRKTAERRKDPDEVRRRELQKVTVHVPEDLAEKRQEELGEAFKRLNEVGVTANRVGAASPTPFRASVAPPVDELAPDLTASENTSE